MIDPRTRRGFLLASLALVAGGCASSKTRTAQLPGAPWDKVAYDPAGPEPRTDRRIEDWDRSASSQESPSDLVTATPFAGVISRTEWASRNPIPQRMNMLGRVSRITVHHDGMSPFFSATMDSSAARLEAIRRVHQDQRRWGDIGYHFIIDRAGRVWEGRPLAFQGAHVKNQNENNLGIMCMGNFDRQSPAEAQLASLISHLDRVMSLYRVPVSRLRTHQELAATACPGRSLQRYMTGVRSSSRLG